MRFLLFLNIGGPWVLLVGYDSADHSDARFLIKIDKHGFDVFLIIIDKGIAEMLYLGLFQPL